MVQSAPLKGHKTCNPVYQTCLHQVHMIDVVTYQPGIRVLQKPLAHYLS